MSIALVIVVCLSGQPDTCKEVQVPADLSLMECMVWGQPIAAEMLRDMPQYRLKGWHCRMGGGKERKA